MTWLQRLYETYERCAEREPDDGDKLLPISHTTQKAHVEIVLDSSGNSRRASVVPPNDATTLIPCTESSAGRSGSKPVNHPLCDKLQYVAGDFLQFGGVVTSGFARDPGEPHREFVGTLSDWSNSDFAHPKVKAILIYIQRGHLVRDMVNQKVLHLDAAGRLLEHWDGEKANAPAIFNVLGASSQHDALVRWRVEGEIGDPKSGTWEDEDLVESWKGYYGSRHMSYGFCMVTGEDRTLAIQHPARLRNAGDKAKLISANDTSGYTFRGRFLDADQTASVGYEVTQKAHNALRWLISRQGYRDGEQVFVAWSPGGARIPAPLLDTDSLMEEGEEPADTAESYARRLKTKISGYQAQLGEREDVLVMGLNSATPGRMSITFYRTLTGSEFLARLQRWHNQFAWFQHYSSKRQFVGAPAPREIAQVAFGSGLDPKLRQATVERLMPCIIDGAPLPRDLLQSAVRRACSRAGLERWEWLKCLGIACALFKGYHSERSYQMALERDRRTRDYLYGRLLAVADNIENYALRMAQEGRSTTAERLTQRFADRPASTWRTIELALTPYKMRLRSNESGQRFLYRREVEMQEIKDLFVTEEFISDSPLSGEFLLSFDVERRALFARQSADGDPSIDPSP